MADSNVKGTITLSGNGQELGTAQTGPDLVAKIETELWNPGGINEMVYSFLPDETDPDLTSYEPVEGMLPVKWRAHGIAREVVYTSPDAPVNGQGTREDPVDLQTMLNSAMPGQTIIMLDGTYSLAEQYFIPRNVCGKDGEEITLMPEMTRMVLRQSSLAGKELLSTDVYLITILTTAGICTPSRLPAP